MTRTLPKSLYPLKILKMFLGSFLSNKGIDLKNPFRALNGLADRFVANLVKTGQKYS